MKVAPTSGIYAIVNKVNGKRYVGSSAGIKNRWISHTKMLLSGVHHSPYLQAAWDKYGDGSFEFVILEVCDRESLQAREQHYIDTLQPEYNVSLRTDSPMRGRHLTDNHKRKQAATFRARLTDEIRFKQGSSHRGKAYPKSQETKDKMLASRLARIALMTPEERKATYGSNKGKKLPSRTAESRARSSAGIKAAYARKRALKEA